MIVLSLFDGISCGRIALERAGIQVDAYYASEVDKQAMEVSNGNYPDIIQIGDVRKISYDVEAGILHTEKGDFSVPGIDLLIGGSPCTDFSSIGRTRGMLSEENEEITTLDRYLELKEAGAQFQGQSFLFWEYVRILRETNPTHFLLENVVMSGSWLAIVNENVGVLPVRINSSLVSAQNRPRLYWTNLSYNGLPEDREICLSDILDPNADVKDVSHCFTIQKQMPKLVERYGYLPERFNAYNATKVEEIAPTLSRGSMVTSSCAVTLFVPVENGMHKVENGLMDRTYPVYLTDGFYNLRRLSIREMERLQTLPEDYVDRFEISKSKKGQLIGNGWTVEVIRHFFLGL